MKTNKLSIIFARFLFIVSAVVALVALPFVLIAGIGLLVAVPFGLFARQELNIINKLKTNSKITKQEWGNRYKVLISCGVGVNAVLLLTWIANISNSELNIFERIKPIIICNLLVMLFAVLAHLAKSYSEKKS